ncbi:MAG: sigma-54 dependent transcriptional regulator [Heliobacteriaceae bacterium]|nr:sigma-54 dependent transcriptional regulator [Heliobacteriaceae bacterium]MDD4587707.1 sigma-54 dependent transcriptional regulator [Heliobacteriaceae bacterium]
MRSNCVAEGFQVGEPGGFKVGIYAESMCRLVEFARKYHEDRSIPVLIEGETGTGKEVLARLVHSGRLGKSLPFVDINCAALSPGLFESELFGYEPGSFTGGLATGKKGKLDLAGGGTLFLDEIGDLPLELQAKLLRLVQEREYYRVGGLTKIKADIRLICATNIPLQTKVTAGAFRQDLFFRLKVGYLEVPPLRERKADIIPLANMFMRNFSRQKSKGFSRINPAAAEILLAYRWPGNVRELKNVIEWAVLMHDDREIKPAHLSVNTEKSGPARLPADKEHAPGLRLPPGRFPLEKFIDEIIYKALQLNQGNKAATARYLGISRSRLYERLKRR